jgi:hypothetical protein
MRVAPHGMPLAAEPRRIASIATRDWASVIP